MAMEQFNAYELLAKLRGGEPFPDQNKNSNASQKQDTSANVQVCSIK